MAIEKLELPGGIRSTTRTSFSALIAILDIIGETQLNGHSKFCETITAARGRVIESLNNRGAIESLDAMIQSTLRKIVAGPVADLFLDSSASDRTGLTLKTVQTSVVASEPVIGNVRPVPVVAAT
jgi:hypothetical protein